MENKAHALAAGTFVLVVTALLVALAVWLTRDNGSYNTYELSTSDTITGLQMQAPVRFKGVPVGKVSNIGFDPSNPGNVLVRIQVKDDTPLAPGTFASLAYQGITGLAFVQLDKDDTKPAPPVPPPGEDGIPRLPMQPSQLGALMEGVPEILTQAKEATDRLNKLLGDENQQRISLALESVGEASRNLATLAGHLDATVTQRLDPVLTSVPRFVGDAGASLASVKQAARDVSTTAGEITTTARRLNEKDGPLDRLAQGTGALSRAVDQIGTTTLPRLNRVSDDASRVVRQLGRTITNVNDNPQSLLFGNGAVPPGPGEEGFTAPGGPRR